MATLVKICVLLALVGGAAWGKLEPLTSTKLRKLQQEPCVFVHPWANWCGNCVQELPTLLPRFAAWKGVKVVVIDMGTPFAQAGFAKKWNLLNESPLTTYLKPGTEKLASYRAAIDPDWKGALPHSVLFIRGAKKKTWRGAIDFDAVAREVAQLCR
jgi:hypothetical protein